MTLQRKVGPDVLAPLTFGDGFVATLILGVTYAQSLYRVYLTPVS